MNKKGKDYIFVLLSLFIYLNKVKTMKTKILFKEPQADSGGSALRDVSLLLIKTNYFIIITC